MDGEAANEIGHLEAFAARALQFKNVHRTVQRGDGDALACHGENRAGR